MKILTQDIQKEIKNSGLILNKIENMPLIEVVNKIHSWDGGYDSGHGYDGTREEFITDLNEQLSFLFEFISLANLERCIIAPLHSYTYFEKWSNIAQNDIYKILVRILSNYKIDKRTQCGVDLNPIENETIINSFTEGGFRYISRASFFFPEIALIVQPWHHLNLLFRTENSEAVKEVINHAIRKYVNLEMYDTCKQE